LCGGGWGNRKWREGAGCHGYARTHGGAGVTVLVGQRAIGLALYQVTLLVVQVRYHLEHTFQIEIYWPCTYK